LGSRPPGNLRIFRAALMITGTTIGIGILGLPIKTGLAGVLPSLIVTVAVWAVMLATGKVLADGIIASAEPIDISTLVYRKLGIPGKVMTVIGYLILLYGVITAHLAAGGGILSASTGGVLSVNNSILIFFAAASFIALLGERLVEKINSFLMGGLFLAFCVLMFATASSVDSSRLMHKDWGFLTSTIPIIVSAQAYQLIVPSVCRVLENNSRAVTKALTIGTVIPLVVNALWMVVVVGALPLAGQGNNTILSAFVEGEAATVPLASALHSEVISRFALIFSMVVLVSSYVLQSTAVIGFFEDLLPAGPGPKRRTASAVLGFLPPLAVVYIYPGIFLQALDVVGGGSIILLFGVIPSLMLLKDRSTGTKMTRFLAVCLLLVSLFFMGMEIMQEFGLLRINPNVEYWPLHR
jgi:tyrosine-specific transport protein